MPNPDNKVYQFRSLGGYSLGDRVIIRLAGWLFAVLIKVIGCTLQFEIDGIDYLEDSSGSLSTPIICAWHDRILAGSYFLRNRGFLVMSSISFDAEYTARSIQRLGFGVIKGSSTRGGTRALVEMIRMMKRGFPAVFTVDGPRGPRYQAKPGPPLLAKKTGNPIIPFSVEVKHHWTLNSWDRFQIPRPFSRSKVYFGSPIFVAADAGEAELETSRLAIENALNDLAARGAEWSAAH